jgi:wobble nucleotide-excising tRNase
MNVLKLIEDHGLTLHGDIEHFAELVRADERERIIEKNKPEIEKVNAYIKDLEQAVLAEREACAKVCDIFEKHVGYADAKEAASTCAYAIRARGEK